MIFPFPKKKTSISCWESCFSQQGKHEADLFKAAFLAKSCFACSLWCSLMPWANMNGRKIGGEWSSKVVGAGKVFCGALKKPVHTATRLIPFFWKKGSLKKKSCIWITIQNKKSKSSTLPYPNLVVQKQNFPPNNCWVPLPTKPHRMASWISSLPASLKSGKASCDRIFFRYGCHTNEGLKEDNYRWKKASIWVFPKMVVPNNHGFSY